MLMLCTALLHAQDSYNDRVQRYIQQYYPLAMSEQARAGIPASITLGQGILETEAGSSELMTQANNHFGIKCKNDWQGDTFLHDDDLPQECFKKYKCADDSYKDHSDHLHRNPRYAPLFAIDKTDYAAWAKGLKKCGYATNPQYAQRLIKIIEDFNLQSYTLLAMDSSSRLPAQPLAVRIVNYGKDSAQPKQAPLVASAAKMPLYVNATADTAKKQLPAARDSVKAATSFTPVKQLADSARQLITRAPAPKADTPQKVLAPAVQPGDIRYDSGKVVTANGLKAIYVYKGEMLLKYAVKYNIRYPHLLEMNDLGDAPLPANMLVYLERKLTSGTHARHTVKEGENMLLIAQAEGIQLKHLAALNLMEAGEEPAAGAILELQKAADQKPALRSGSIARKDQPVITSHVLPTAGYVNIEHPAKKDTMPAAAQSVPATAAVTPPVVATASKPVAVIARDTAAPAPQPTSDTSARAADSNVALVKPVIVADSVLPENPHELKGEDTSSDDLEKLKKELDKVVYTDDSQLAKTQSPARPQEKPKPELPKKPEKKEVQASGKYYVVKKGDTLSGIAHKNKVTIRQLMKWNDIDADDLSLGQKIRVKP